MSIKKQGKGGKKTSVKSVSKPAIKPLGEARYTLDAISFVQWDGPEFLSWHQVANELFERDAIAVILAATACPFPLGRGQEALATAQKAAKVALDTNGGRQLALFEVDRKPMTKLEKAACEVYLLLHKEAARNGTAFLGELRLHLARASVDRCNAPVDSYMRLAAGTLKDF